jgi:hypothetical protein
MRGVESVNIQHHDGIMNDTIKNNFYRLIKVSVFLMPI